MMNTTGAQLASTSLGQDQHEIQIPVPSWDNIRQLKADRSLIKEPGEVYITVGAPLFRASIRSDWKAAKAILDKNPELVRYSITENGETTLHVAASVKGGKRVQWFVKNLMDMMESEDLELVNDNNDTALCLAAASGNIDTVRIMLTRIPGGGEMRPLCTAALYGNNEVVRFIYEKSNNLLDGDFWNTENRGWLLEKCLETDMFDVALMIVENYPQLGSGSLLAILARKAYAFSEKKSDIIILVSALIGLWMGGYEKESKGYEKESKAMQLLKIIWEDIAKKPRDEIYAILTGSPNLVEKKRIPYSFQVLFIAAETGNKKFLVELIRQYPDLMLKTNDKNQTIFHIAVKQRHESIYSLLYEIGAMKDLIIALKDDDGNNILHLAAKRPEQEQHDNLSGAVSEMQRELLWFKEVRNMIPPIHREMKNKNGLTPHELFTKEHKKLVKDGEKWTKDAINYCVVVAALITTVTFVAASTIPGGYNQDNGIPIFYEKPTFVVFLVANVMSLIFSSTSILLFLSIITSRIAELDFLESLPKKLWLGISCLFFSIATMMVTFNASFFVIYHNKLQWIPILIGVLGFLPVFIYIMLQYHIILDVLHATYDSRYLFNPLQRSLY